MTLQTALSGLNSAQTGVNTVSNDLANASTTAFKSQAALFEDVYPARLMNVPGAGSEIEGISTDLSQGNVIATGNPLDAAIRGNGYFVVSNNGTQQYTRDGAFHLSSNGELVNASGNTVLGYTASASGGRSGVVGPLSVNTGAMSARASSTINLNFNLPSTDPIIPTTVSFNQNNPATYSEATSIVAYDSLGNANRINLYFVHQPPVLPSTSASITMWAVPVSASGTPVAAATKVCQALYFQNGAWDAGPPMPYSVNWKNGSKPSNLTFTFKGSTFQNQAFAMNGVTNDGYAPGSYTGASISSSGQVLSTYSNGQNLSNGTLAIANFINPEGLEPITGNLFASTQNSGVAVTNVPGAGQAGTLVGGNLEASNVSTSSLLVSLIQYQQAYQANTSVIQAEQQDSQRLVQI